MGIIQLNQIETRVAEKYEALIDTADAREPETSFKTRGLAAWALEEVSGCTPEEAAASIVDGFRDNGIDSIHIDDKDSMVYLVQSKWSKSGTGSASVGDVHKFIQGFRDLVNAEFGRFNAKVRAKQVDLEHALADPDVKFTLILAHTGSNALSGEARQVIEDLLSEVNDPIDTASFMSLTQSELHAFLRRGVRGAQPDLKVTLHEWGHTQEPYAAFYGQVDASSIAEWFSTYRTSLFDKNLREFLGRSSEVNSSLLQTLRTAPEHFWYLNNGITVLCESVGKSAAGSTMKKSGSFEFTGASIVNGAQTVGCIGEAALEDPALVADARVMVRFISLDNCPPGFASEVTRGTNTQNRVERRDFVALDTEQIRLREELAIDGITYSIKSGERTPDPATGCSIIEATVALACSQRSSEMAVQAKREIGRLWVGAESAASGSLYRRMFNASTTGRLVWRTVRALRAIDETLSEEQKQRVGRERQIGVHGNRIIAHLTFQEIGPRLSEAEESSVAAIIDEIESVVRDKYARLIQVIEEGYAGNYLASLFKNAKRCAEVEAAM